MLKQKLEDILGVNETSYTFEKMYTAIHTPKDRDIVSSLLTKHSEKLNKFIESEKNFLQSNYLLLDCQQIIVAIELLQQSYQKDLAEDSKDAITAEIYADCISQKAKSLLHTIEEIEK